MELSGAERYFNNTLDADGDGLVDVSEIVQWVRNADRSRPHTRPDMNGILLKLCPMSTFK